MSDKTSLEKCKMIKTALFQENAWGITHSLPDKTIHGKEIHLTLDEDDFLVHLDRIEYTSKPCDWEDVFEDLVIMP